MQLTHEVPYSYRDDRQVPAFPDESPIVFMDGSCALCSMGARAIARFDRREEFLIATTEGPLGQAVLRHYGLDPSDPDSWLYLEEGRAYTSMDAIIRVGRRLGGLGKGLAVFSILPRGMQDWLYARIARNRYRLLGRADLCAIPDPAVQRRLIH